MRPKESKIETCQFAVPLDLTPKRHPVSHTQRGLSALLVVLAAGSLPTFRYCPTSEMQGGRQGEIAAVNGCNSQIPLLRSTECLSSISCRNSRPDGLSNSREGRGGGGGGGEERKMKGLRGGILLHSTAQNNINSYTEFDF